jgi:predicted nucleic acid-binding protein
MKTALDTNILSTIWSGQPMEAAARVALNAASRRGFLVISPFAYAEALAHPSYSEEQIQRFLAITGISVDFAIAEPVWIEAGRRYRDYAVRRRQATREQPRRILADFLVGAHALLQADQLMTFDIRMYRTNFPELRLYPIEG